MTLTTTGNIVAAATDCAVAITGLTVTSTVGAPAYTVAVQDGTAKAQAATVPNTVSGAAVFAAAVLTDTIALSNQVASSTGGTLTYTWQSDVTLAIGTTLTMVLPGFSGTPATSTSCANGGGTELGFSIATTGGSSTKKERQTKTEINIAEGTESEKKMTGGGVLRRYNQLTGSHHLYAGI